MIETKPSQILLPYFDAGYPIVAVETFEEMRLMEDMRQFVTHAQQTDPDKRGARLFSIAAAGGLREETEGKQKVIDQAGIFPKAFSQLTTFSDSFLVVFDFQHIIKGAAAYRPLLQYLPVNKQKGNCIILVAPSWNLPEELRHEIPVIPLPLPSPDELLSPLGIVREGLTEQIQPTSTDADLVQAARGLTMSEAENIFALSAQSRFDRAVVEREKMRLIKSACMSVENPADPKLLGGLGRLKEYIHTEVVPVRDDEQLRVRAILLVGIPGAGKSLSAKVIASILGWPLVRFNLSDAKGGIVGQSEANIRLAQNMADALAPCVLWEDEIEKAVGGYASSAQTDGGTTMAMVGSHLTWLQEHTSPVLVVATCNDFSKLPPELTRAGRFDERFFLDLPIDSEREQIGKIHLKRLGCKQENLTQIVSTSAEWTGGEIEQLIKSAARRTQRNIDQAAIENAAKDIIPISKTSSIQELRNWAKNNLRWANDQPEQPKASRKVKSQPWAN